jgi:transposase
VQLRVANLRADVLHKAATALAQRHQVIVVEDLNVAGMSRRKPGAGRGGRPPARRGPPPRKERLPDHETEVNESGNGLCSGSGAAPGGAGGVKVAADRSERNSHDHAWHHRHP